MTCLGIFAAGCLGLLADSVNSFYRNGAKRLVLLVVFTQIQLLLVLFLIKGDFAFKFYGTPNRNTGFLTYTSLNILLLAAAIASTTELLRKAAKILMLLGSILSLYGLAQSRGLEIFSYVNVYGSNVFSTLGNPNFQSAFMGITGSVIFTWISCKKNSNKVRILLFSMLLLCFYNIYLTSQQGYLSLTAGVISVILIHLWFSGRVILLKIVSMFTVIGTLLVVFAIFNLGPLASFIYQSSLQARNFYWNAATKMIISNPLFGVGLDGFGDHYYRFRSTSAVEFNKSLSSDTAHNVALDIGSSGGLPLLLLYLGFVVLTMFSIYKILSRAKEFDAVLVSLIAGWVAYTVQSLISVNQIGVGVWGWILSGLVIGYEINSREKPTLGRAGNFSAGNGAITELKPKQILSVFIAITVGFGVSLPPYVAATRFYNVLQSGNYELLIDSSFIKPNDRTRYFYAAQILAENKKELEAVEILRRATVLYPDYYQLWGLWASLPSASTQEIAQAKAEIRRLDPFNPELK
jgi:O-antigen ligase